MAELCLKIKRAILKRIFSPDEIYALYEKDNFNETIKGLALALCEILEKESHDLVIQILQIFRNIALHDDDYERINSCHKELKRILDHINGIRINKPSFETNFKDIIKNIENTIRILINRKKNFILPMAETLIEKRRDLNIINALIRDNKDILEFKGENSHNLLWRLLEKYSELPPNKKEEIDYLYQVILLFITNKELEHSISLNKKYYLTALKNRDLAHVREIIKILERKQKISVGRLETRCGINKRLPQTYWHDQASYFVPKDGGKIYDFSKLPTCSIDAENAVCLDDAFSLVRNKDGSYTLYRHTTFIPQIVPYDSVLNIDSINQIKTLYLNGDTRTLYPPATNFASSLRRGKIRHAETSIWRIKPDFTLEEGSYQLVRSIIKNDHQLSFEQADRMFQQNEDSPLTEILIKSNEIANQLATSTFPKYSCSSSKSFQTKDKPVINTIRNFGLLNNLSIIDLVSERGIPYIYVACDKVQSLDFNGSFFKGFTGDLRQVPEHIGGFEYYTTTPRKHYGLGYQKYSQVGSPLRISVSGQIQYIERDLIFNPNPSDEQFHFWQEQTAKLVNHYNKNTPALDAFVGAHNQLEGNNRLVRRKGKND